VIDYDYIMRLMAASTEQGPKKQKATRQQIIDMLRADAKFADDAEDMAAYFAGLPTDRGLTEAEIREGYERYKREQEGAEIAATAEKHGLDAAVLRAFAQTVAGRAVLDSEALGELMRPLDLGWKARAAAEGALMTDLIPILKKMAGGRDISGLAAYE
jgi:type I restriction enzyme R subunit